MRQTLLEIQVHPRVTLLDEARAYVAAGRALGVIESRKNVLNDAAPAPTRAGTAAARTEWIQTMNLVLATAKRLKGDHAARFAPVLREIQRVEAKSDARRPRADAAAEGDAPADDAQPDNDAPAAEPVAKTG